MLDPAIGVLLIACFAALFASAALHKLGDLPHFTEVLRAYRVLPEGAVRFAPLVAVAEAAVAVGLALTAARFEAALAGAALLLAYAAAIAVNLGRGRRDLACGCGGPDARPIAPWMVARNLTLALLLVMTLLAWKTRPLLPTDAVTIGGGTVIATLLYACLDRLLAAAPPGSAALKGPS